MRKDFSTFLKTDHLTLAPSFMKGLKSINPKGIYPQTDTEVLFWTKAQYFLELIPTINDGVNIHCKTIVLDRCELKYRSMFYFQFNSTLSVNLPIYPPRKIA